MTDEQTLLAAIVAEPGDDLARLAYADWLEEHAQDRRAALLRAICKLRQLPVMRAGRERTRLEKVVVGLLTEGVRPAVPEVVNSVGMRLTLIPPGVFRMGSPSDEANRQNNEHAHEVEITRPFYLGVFAVTQSQFEQVMGTNPSRFRAGGSNAQNVEGMDTSDFPVDDVLHPDAVEFCRRLTDQAKEKAARRVYRLPTEAEWEYACRGGACSTGPFHFGKSITPELANVNGYSPAGGASLGRTSAVGSYRPNAFGLYDMHGNVWEWCSDYFAPRYYLDSPRVDPKGPAQTAYRSLRGGSWYYVGHTARSAYRARYGPNYMSFAGLGLRVVCEIRSRRKK